MCTQGDRMLDMGFEPQIKRIIGEIPSEQRQTLFFTATWSKSVQKMAVKYLRSSGDLVNITVGSTEELVANTMVLSLPLCPDPNLTPSQS
jgi:ATP-dependent RNA helicase DDX5/DBP2